MSKEKMLLQGEALSGSTKKYPNLKQWLLDQAKCVGAVIANEQSVLRQDNYFYFLCLPWILLESSEENKELWSLRKEQFSQLGFNGDTTFDGLARILEEDAHLRECCPTP